jgi:hypothetical protein
MKIKLYFKNWEPLSIVVENNTTGRLYFDLVKKHYANDDPFFKDNIKWTPEYLRELAHVAKQELGWDWLLDDYTLDVTAQLHKDLEYSVGRVGFENMPEEYDWLLYDLHHCLHSIQNGKTEPKRDCNLQLEWLSDDSIPLPSDFEFITNIKRGDLILINPYVGHNPLQLYMENDFSDLESTCKFHDKIKPAIVISSFSSTVTKQAMLNRMLIEDPAFVNKHTREKILYYSGSARIGYVENLEFFESVVESSDELVFDKLEFDE